jgi:hypothetical protein
MKKLQLIFTAAILLLTVFIACKKAADQGLQNTQNNSANTATVISGASAKGDILPSAGTCNSNAYIVTLESRTQVGNSWEWVWSVQNSNPGNGNGGTVQNLSHWGMQFGPCNVMNSVVSAAYSADGITWTSFVPVYQTDPSQGCVTTPVLKFDYGTAGSAKSYYKLVLNQDFPVGASFGYYKSGVKTGCCTFTFNGIRCPEDGDIR